MKEQSIKRINSIGRAGNVIALICRIVLIIAMLGLISAIIVVNVLPNELVTVELGTNVGVKVDFSSFGGLPSEAQTAIRESIEEAGEDLSQDGDITDYEITETSFSFRVGDATKTFGVRDVNGPLFAGLLYVVGSYVILWFVAMLCRALRDCNSPFDEPVIRRMRNFAFSLIGWSVLSIVCNAIVSHFFPSGFKISSGFNLGTILLVLVILGLCGIFRYGAKLQKEHDETL